MCRLTLPCAQVAQAAGFGPRLPPWLSARVWRPAQALGQLALTATYAARPHARAWRRHRAGSNCCRCGSLRRNRVFPAAPARHMAAAHMAAVHTERGHTEAERIEAEHIEVKCIEVGGFEVVWIEVEGEGIEADCIGVEVGGIEASCIEVEAGRIEAARTAMRPAEAYMEVAPIAPAVMADVPRPRRA